MVCTSLGSLLHPLFYFLCYIHFSLTVQRGPQEEVFENHIFTDFFIVKSDYLQIFLVICTTGVVDALVIKFILGQVKIRQRWHG